MKTELCGGAEHDGPCPWPHNNAMDRWGDSAFRTLFIAPESDEPEVRSRIEAALRSSDQWLVRFNRARPLQFDERALATRLASTPEQSGPTVCVARPILTPAPLSSRVRSLPSR